MITLKINIDKIMMKKKYKYIKYKYYILVWKLIMNYFMKKYENKDMRKYIEINIQMQMLFKNELIK